MTTAQQTTSSGTFAEKPAHKGSLSNKVRREVSTTSLMKITVLWVAQEECWDTLKMAAENSSETSVTNYKQTRLHSPEYCSLPSDNFVNLLHILMNENT